VVVLVTCGLLYLVVRSFVGILLLRVLNGAGQFCMGAGAMVLLVSIIPPANSGQAFGAYSVAFLTGYAVVPALSDALSPFLPTPAHGYAAATVLLLPALPLIHRLRNATRTLAGLAATQRLPTVSELRENLAQPSVALLLAINASYFVNWSAVFFLFKGFAQLHGVRNVGAFLSVQTVTMIVIRIGAGRLFDSVDKAWLIVASFAAIAVGHLALDHLPGTWAVPFLGALFGVGLGAGYPAINGLMFELSPPRFRALNANLMLFAVQLGFFVGPALGGVLVARTGYHGYFVASMVLALVSAASGATLARTPLTRSGLPLQ
jgi:MFS family permease